MKGYFNNLRPFEKRVVVGVVVLLFVVANAVAVFPHFKDWGVAKKRLDAARKKVATYQGEIAQLPHYQKDLKDLGLENQVVLTEEQSHNFSSAIQSQAASSRVQIQQVGRLSSRTNGEFLELSQGIVVLSGEKEIVDFLYHLGAGSSQIRARDLSLRPDGPRYQLGSTIKLVASYQKKPAAPAAAQPPPKPAAPTFKPSTPSTPTNKAAGPAAKTPSPPAKAPGPAAKTGISTNKPATTKKP
jgi:hypothetical protein